MENRMITNCPNICHRWSCHNKIQNVHFLFALKSQPNQEQVVKYCTLAIKCFTWIRTNGYTFIEWIDLSNGIQAKEKHLKNSNREIFISYIFNVENFGSVFITVCSDISQSPSSFLGCKLQNAFIIRVATVELVIEIIKKKLQKTKKKWSKMYLSYYAAKLMVCLQSASQNTSSSISFSFLFLLRLTQNYG